MSEQPGRGDIGEELLRNTLQAISALPSEVAKMRTEVDEIHEDFDDLKRLHREEHKELREAIKGAANINKSELKEMRSSLVERSRNRVQIIIALVGAGAIVMAAIITALVTLLSSHG